MMEKKKKTKQTKKTEAMFVTSRRASAADSVPTSLRVGLSDIKFASQVKNLSITSDCYLTLHHHVTNICESAYVELRRIASIRQYLSSDATKTLISAFALSKVDYCDSLFAGTPKNIINKLLRAHNKRACFSMP